MTKKLLKIICLVALASILSVCAITPFMSSADMVEIESGKDIDLTYYSLNGKAAPDTWDHVGSLTSDASAKYVLKSNGWAQWLTADNMAFGYKELAFNYSDRAQITAETTMISFDGTHIHAGAGLMLRSSLDEGASCLMMHFRQNFIMVTYRSKDGGTSTQGKTIETPTSALYPVTFKVTVVKGQARATCYYKVGNGEYTEYATVPFNYGSKIYAGISAYSQDQTYTATAKFTSFSYLVEAPEGYTIEDGDEDTSSQPEEEVIELPEDLPVTENILLRETFTDGSMTNDNGETQNDVTNPIWTGTTDVAVIETNEEQTDRWLYEYVQGESYYLAGDRAWTDYKTSFDLDFTNEYSEGELNKFYAFVRTTDMGQYGYQYYYILIRKETVNGTRLALELGHSPSNTNLSVENTYAEAIESVPLDVELADFVGEHNLTIETFDNRITVILDGETLIEYYDETEFVKPSGCIGFGSNGAAVRVDNIIVTKMDDLLGGDYDNRIAGNWNDEEPSYLDRFKDEDAIY